MSKRGKDTMPHNLHGAVCAMVKHVAGSSSTYKMSQMGMTVTKVLASPRRRTGVHLNQKAAEALVA